MARLVYLLPGASKEKRAPCGRYLSFKAVRGVSAALLVPAPDVADRMGRSVPHVYHCVLWTRPVKCKWDTVAVGLGVIALTAYARQL